MSVCKSSEAEEEGGGLECRICRETNGQLVSPCRCNTVVHRACLERWVGYREDALFPLLSAITRDVCEVCRHPFNTRAHSPWDGSMNNDNDSTGNTNKDDRCALSRAVAVATRRLYVTAFTVESCLCVFLFVLAVMGHALFVLGMYKGVETDEHSLKRIALAIANAVLTFTLLFVVLKLTIRWLRDSENGLNSISSVQIIDTDTNSVSVSDVEAQHVPDRYGNRCSTLSQVIVGAVLSVIAAAEIFLIVRELPLGGLA